MRTKIGILYSLQNVNAWDNYKKLGRTTQKINKRMSNLQTSLIDNCELICVTDILLDTCFYEYLLKKILKNYRLRSDREFYDIEPDEIKEIFDNFNFINTVLNTEEKLNEYIKNNHPEYFRLSKKRSYSEMCSSDSYNSSNKKKLKKRRYIYIDTSY
jgi:hypothetical protein